jgi:hypothetical protein
MRGMPTTAVQGEADLSLRAASAFSRLRVFWPPDTSDGAPIVVFVTEQDPGFETARALSSASGSIVLALDTTELEVVMVALEWAAEHGTSLGADPDRLHLVGGTLAAAAARRVRTNGWPRLAGVDIHQAKRPRVSPGPPRHIGLVPYRLNR